jgi:hypothetical protein
MMAVARAPGGEAVRRLEDDPDMLSWSWEAVVRRVDGEEKWRGRGARSAAGGF